MEANLIIALAGRRIDRPGAKPPIFPYEAVERVRQKLKAFFEAHGITVLVSSASCGADLIALEAAGELGMRRRVILPFETKWFRDTSVTDRAGDWGEAFDRIISEAASEQDLITLALEPEADESYLRTNGVILAEAISLGISFEEQVNAMLVWNGVSRGEDDITNQFGVTARSLGLHVFELSTL
jgi:hypothetical protein